MVPAALATTGILLGLIPSDAVAQTATDWPSFRGHHARGIATGFATATQWEIEDKKQVAWRAKIPGLAHSSPVIWGDHLYVTSAVRSSGQAKLSSLYGSKGYGAGESVEDEGKHAYVLYCLDKNSGEIIWKHAARAASPRTKRHPKSSHANPTPACDDKRVIAFFGSEGLYGYDHQGQPLWERDLGVLDTGAPGHRKPEEYQWGFASSPILFEDKVIVQCDVQGQSFLALFDADSGEEIWRVLRDEGPTWCTPTIHQSADGEQTQIIVNGYKHIGSYDLANGDEIWKLAGGGDIPVPTPVVAHGLVYLTSAHGRMRPIRAIRADAQGDLTSSSEKSDAIVWSHPRRGIYMQTPLVYGDHLYLCSDGGILTCYDAKSGEQIYRERLGSGRTGFSGSPVAADAKLYFCGESGEIFVVRAGSQFEILAINEMGETCMSTPAISEGRLFIRTRHHITAIANPQD